MDRLRGASKYFDADDNARLVEEASIDGFLLKQVRRSVVGLPGVSRPTKFHLEWCCLGVPLCLHAIDATLRLLDGVEVPRHRRDGVTDARAAGASSRQGRCTILVETQERR